MTDRELLELAAKAARTTGADIIDSETGPQIFERHSSDGWECYRLWIPMTDDSDALRLAIDLGIRIDFAKGWTVAYSGSCASEQFSERHEDSPYAATRRAIVRAAAEIGRCK